MVSRNCLIWFANISFGFLHLCLEWVIYLYNMRKDCFCQILVPRLYMSWAVFFLFLLLGRVCIRLESTVLKYLGRVCFFKQTQKYKNHKEKTTFFPLRVIGGNIYFRRVFFFIIAFFHLHKVWTLLLVSKCVTKTWEQKNNYFLI